MGLRYSKRKGLGKGFFIGMGSRGPSVGRRGRRGSVSLSRRGLGGSIRLAKGLSYRFRHR